MSTMEHEAAWRPFGPRMISPSQVMALVKFETPRHLSRYNSAMQGTQVKSI